MKKHLYYLKKIIALAIFGSLFIFVGCTEDSFEENVVSLEEEIISVNASALVCDQDFTDNGFSLTKGTRNYRKTIDISCSSSVTLSLDAEGKGPMESADYMRIYYKVDGGSQKTIYTKNDSFSKRSFEVDDIEGNSLQLIVDAKNSASNETHILSNVRVSSDGSSGGGGDGSNLALGKTTQQSSTSFNASSSRAVDGNTSGVWNQGSVTHTANTFQPWWQVLLGSNSEIGEIKIWNRTNCCTSRLSNFDVFVYNENGTQVFKRTITSTPNPSVSINTGGVVGSRVRIKLKGTNPLSLAEVQVFGVAGDGGSNDDDDDDNAGGGGSGSAAAIIGGMNSHWKLNGFSGSLNVGSGSYGKDGSNGLDYEDRASTNDNNNWFFDTNGYAAFKCHVGNPTSSGSGNMRSELRELDGSGDEIEWDGTTNTNHRMRYKVQIRRMPTSGKLCFGQIHGSGNFDDVIRLQIDDSNENRGATSGKTSGTYDVVVKGYVTEELDRDNRNKSWARIAMNREYDVEISMRDEVVKVFLDGNNIYTSKKVNSKDNYFKAGAYLQSAQSDKSPQLKRSSNNFGEVWIKDMRINH